MSSSPTSTKYQSDEATKAARALIIRFPEKAIEILEGCAVDELRKSCARAGLDYLEILLSPKEPEPSEGTRRRRTNDSLDSERPSNQRHSSSDTTATRSVKEGSGSSSSLDRSRKRIVVPQSQVQNDQKLEGNYDPDSYFMILSSIVDDRLEESMKDLARPIACTYGGNSFQCEQAVELTWKYSGQTQTHRNIFLVVFDLPDTDIVLGSVQPQRTQLQDCASVYSLT
jgi:hypothetical protein